ncbi:MAG: pyruvate kinase [Candidatus Atribacteria bacterium]|uniref:Pyruvate kinase n=1 Tax=Thermatribacter velox TaxID=3039681 RepID=A0ABZ2YAT6_9BACT|nr:pyruvate kinase [Candidatus Atribacteria bacterium]MDI3531214.1 pyruvate kinase [Candidatus Atribacteria bacterium]
MRKTKIVCTLGPASLKREVIREMIQSGMDVARLNFSHGDHDFHREIAHSVREESKVFGKPVALLQDLQGIKIRIGEAENGVVELKENSIIEVVPGNGLTTSSRIYINYEPLLKDIQEGEEILLDDGLLRLKVTSKHPDRLLAEVIEGGPLRSRKGVNFPHTRISACTFTEKDRYDLKAGIEIGVDYVALSFVRKAEDILRVKEWAKKEGFKLPPLIAKIEKKEALENVEEIVEVAEGIMVARGDLGVEISTEMVPVWQKLLVEAANRKGKIVIIATQMLESMREHTSPTRAEATDVANAVLDGTDALMLSAETAIGKFPALATRTMHSIICATEQHLYSRIFVTYDPQGIFPEAMVSGAIQTAQDIKAKAIVVFTHSGFTATLISNLRPATPVIAMTPDPNTFTRLPLLWGVYPHLLTMREKTVNTELLKEAEEILVAQYNAQKGDPVVFVASSPFLGNRNLLRLHRIGDPLEEESQCNTDSVR